MSFAFVLVPLLAAPPPVWTVEILDALLVPEVVRHSPEGVRPLAAPDGRRWLAVRVLVTPPRPGAGLPATSWTVVGAGGASLSAQGIAGRDAGAVAPTFVLFDDALGPRALAFPPARRQEPDWAYLYATGSGGRTGVAALTYTRVEDGRPLRSLRLAGNGRVMVDERRAELVFLFAAPESLRRFTLRLGGRPAGTATARPADAPPEAPLVSACAAGDGDACFRLAEAFAQGAGVPSDEARRVDLLERGCEVDHGRSCAALAHHVGEGRGAEKDPRRAVDLLQKACDQGDMEGCTAAGVRYLAGDGVYKDARRAITAFTRACEKGDAAACNNLGAVYAGGGEVPRERRFAIELYRRACTAGSTVGCVNLSRMYAVDGPEADWPGAVPAHARACGLGDPWSCVTLAYRYAEGRGVPRDPAAAATYYGKACEAGETSACAGTR